MKSRPTGRSPVCSEPVKQADLEVVLRERCAFLHITAKDCDHVRELASLFGTYIEPFVESFYAHLKAFAGTAALLQDPAVVQRLKGLQKQYFESLLRANLNVGYIEERQRIGWVHARVGVEPHWFLGAFNQYIQLCITRLTQEQPSAAAPTYAAGLASLLKLILLDIGLSLDAYWARATSELRTALDLYSQSNAELREFAHLVSHDLKTPLATISALCEEFLDEFGAQVPAEARGLVEGARLRTLKTKTMIDELLAGGEAAAQPHQRAQVSMRSMLDEVLARVRPEIGSRSITIEIPEKLPEVHVHPGRVQEVFYHLLSNAIKFMDKKEGKVSISVVPGSHEHVFCVADNGPGIAPSDLPRVFAAFRRLPQHAHLPGSGLGLYFVRKIVEEQGGRVWAESQLGVGSRFYVTLPAKSSETESVRLPHSGR